MVDAELKRLLAERIESVRLRIAEAARRSGRKAEAIQLVAVSKFHPLEDLLAAVDCGVDILGESRVQEALSKREVWPEDKKVRWHLIGHLQKNKARKALELFDLIESVDDIDLAETMERILAEQERPVYPVLLEVNISGEASKHGIQPEAAESLLNDVRSRCPHLRVEGLMAIAAIQGDARISFAKLRELSERLRLRTGLPLPELSMGMSGDFETAIEEGSTLVRVGTAIFGPRSVL